MNITEADTVLEVLSGYWPTPALTDEEVKAWYTELCQPALKITTEEASKVIARQARSGHGWRMRPGAIVPEVQTLRRDRALTNATKALMAQRHEPALAEVRTKAIAECRAAIEKGKRIAAEQRAKRRKQAANR